MKTQNSTISAKFNPNAKTKFTTSHRKEGKGWVHTFHIIDAATATKGERAHGIELRTYTSGGSTSTACLWIQHHVPGAFGYVSGSGNARGYGYCRKSAAAEEAINNAGFTLSKTIGGVGESAIREALFAIAEDIGMKTPVLVESYA
jgi:hypothetical protein